MKEEVSSLVKGEVFDDSETLTKYSKDASLFQVMPKLVVFPKDADDIKALVKYVSEKGISLNVRAAGSCMSGGSLGEEIVADVTQHMNAFEISTDSAWVEPGLFYRDFEAKALEKGLLFPPFPASKNLAAFGGMLGNNCAGEKTLRYGKMENFILESKAIFSDGNEYAVKPLTKEELGVKIGQNDFEGNIYKQVWEIIEKNQNLLADSKPKVSKNSAGYYLWNVWDGNTFDLNKLLVGSQGTLGIFTKARIKLMPIKEHHDLIAFFFKSWDELPKVVNAILPFQPESLETFDEETLKLGIKFMPEIARKAHMNLLRFAAKFLPEAIISAEMLGLPELIVLAEVAEETEAAVKDKVSKIMEALKPLSIHHHVVEKDSEEEKFWVMRRESFNLLRQHVKGKRTAPFIDDFCIRPDAMPEFLPQAKKVLEDSGIKVNIAGHAGDGNYHIIPLMDFTQASERAKIAPVSDKIFDLVGKYHGSITAEHNDGIVRTPYLGKMYKPEMLALFQKTKDIFDPKGILNPGKKVGGTVEYMEKHIAAA